MSGENLNADNNDSENDQSMSQEENLPSSVHNDNSKSAREIELEELLTGLKEKYSNLKRNDPLKVRILTVLPDSWSISKIAKEFNASRRLVREAKALKRSRGVQAETTAETRNKLPTSTVEKVIEFYNDDSNSRMVPGQKDKISVVLVGERTQVQKRLMLLDLQELYDLFKKENPLIDIGFSTFAKLKPKHCILPGANGTHSVCVCTIHQNCKLMLDAIDLSKLTNNSLYDYKDCLKEIMCEILVLNAI